jgi:hypothetical protein
MRALVVSWAKVSPQHTAACFKSAGFFKEVGGTSDRRYKGQKEHATDPDNLQLNELDMSDKVTTHLQPSRPFQEYKDDDTAVPICEQLMEDDIIRTIQTPEMTPVQMEK